MEEKKTNNFGKVVMLIIVVAIITFILTIVGTYKYFETGTILETDKENVINFSKYKEIIDENYLGEVDNKKLQDYAIKGYFAGLGDPYTEYITPEEMEEYMQDTKGNFVGIGIYMIKDQKNNRVVVASPIKGSPAEKAGLLPGDAIIKVNGKEYTGEDFNKISKDIKGESGTTVELEILRENQIKTFKIKREKITINPVESKLINNNIGYIKFGSFDEGTAKQFEEKFLELKDNNIKSLIIDLRNNGGGIVTEALEITDLVVDKNEVLLYEVDKNQNEEIKKSKKDPIIKMPIVVLVNENTASSAEILAGALKDHEKAKIVGTKTYGKGVIQTILPLANKGGVKITTEEYLTPNKKHINKLGIEPDEKVELNEEDKNKLEIEENNDTQLKKAIELLK